MSWHVGTWEVLILGGLSITRPGETIIGWQRVAVLMEEAGASGEGRSVSQPSEGKSTFHTGGLERKSSQCLPCMIPAVLETLTWATFFPKG